ncbi:ferritin-like domain-containing protein [Rhodopseudomonas sp.]|uniref:ferritin-like domain-containing protein n=1 Tax=Rhodopseudomonas sp. TaxID=1078 RepID=UPI003B3AC934
MAQDAREIFITGLRNAHAMETQAREMMERQSERLDEYPDVKARITAHLHETETQLKRLDECLASVGESSSTLKDTTQSLMGNMAALAHTVMPDEILKNTFANNAFEHFEIAAYKSLLSLADLAGMSAAKPLLQASLKEEEAMAAWIDQNIDNVTRSYVRVAQATA